jgi:hypothetical protein
VIGSFRHQFNSAYGMQINVYDAVSSFGQIFLSNLNGLPDNFEIDPNPFSPGVGGVGGCVFGEEGGTGICFDDAFQSIDASDFRVRGVNILFSGERGPWSMGIGGGYSQRKYLAPGVTPDGFTLDDRRDHSFTLNGYMGRALSRDSSINLDAYAVWFDPGVPGFDDSFGAGVTGSYYQTLWSEHWRGVAAVGLYTSDSGEFDQTVASGLIGLRYTF